MAETQQINPTVQNAIARATLLQSGIKMVKRLQPVTGTLGSQIRVPLLRMGIMTGVLLQFTVPVTTSAAVDPGNTQQPFPYNLAQTVEYQDFAGVKRTRTSGFQLHVANSMKQGDPMGRVPAYASYSSLVGVDSGYSDDVFSITAANGVRVRGLPSGDSEVRFSLYVPMAYDPNSDLTGAVLTQTSVGEHFININLLNNLKGDSGWDSWVKSAAGDVALNGSVVVEAFQHYIQPQSMTADTLPVIDLAMIYGLEGNFITTADIASNMSTFINLPNNRSVFSSLVNFQNGGDFSTNGADLNQITVIANSNTNFREMSPRYVKETMQNAGGFIHPAGSYFLSFRSQPIITQLYAQVQARFDVKTKLPTGVTQFIAQHEVQYPSGAPLPGIGNA